MVWGLDLSSRLTYESWSLYTGINSATVSYSNVEAVTLTRKLIRSRELQEGSDQ